MTKFKTTHPLPALNKLKKPTKVLVEKFYHDMVRIRRFEEKTGQLYGMGHIGGFCHLYIGQEAVVVGTKAALMPQDTLITSYRDHGHMLVCGMDPKGVFAELTGRQDGHSKGKGGSMHMFSTAKNFYGGHGIVGAQISIGAGMAFAHKYRGDGGCTVASMGDGAADQGQVYEAFNLAKIWNLPIIFMIENNGYSMGTSLKRHGATTDLYKRGLAHDIMGLQADGMDVLCMFEAAQIARSYVEKEKAPILIEAKTYRYRGHSMSDPATYRDKEEVAAYKKLDSIEKLKQHMMSVYKYTEAVLKNIDKQIREEMKEASAFSLTSPEPDLSELTTDILKENDR